MEQTKRKRMKYKELKKVIKSQREEIELLRAKVRLVQGAWTAEVSRLEKEIAAWKNEVCRIAKLHGEAETEANRLRAKLRAGTVCSQTRLLRLEELYDCENETERKKFLAAYWAQERFIDRLKKDRDNEWVNGFNRLGFFDRISAVFFGVDSPLLAVVKSDPRDGG